MRNIYAASSNLFTLTGQAERVLCQLVMFLTVQNEIQLLSRVFCYSWLVCLLGFWLRNMSLVKVGNPISDGIVFVFVFCLLFLPHFDVIFDLLLNKRTATSAVARPNGQPRQAGVTRGVRGQMRFAAFSGPFGNFFSS